MVFQDKYIDTQYLLLWAILCLMFILWSCQEDKPRMTAEAQYLEDYRSPEAKWGFIDTLGILTIPYSYDGVRNFSEGLCAVNTNGHWGYIDKKNIPIITPRFKSAWPFTNGRARVKTLNNEYLWIDRKGNTVNEFIHYDQVFDLKEGYAVVRNNSLYGLIDSTGKEVVHTMYHEIVEIKSNKLIAKNHTYQLLNMNGKDLLNKSYAKIRIIDNDRIYIEDEGSSYIFNIHTKQKINLDFRIYGPFYENHACFDTDGGVGLINSMGKIAINPSYDEIVFMGQGQWAATKNKIVTLFSSSGDSLSGNYQMLHRYKNGLAAFKQNDLWGFLDLSGQEYIPATFSMVWDFNEGRAQIIGEQQLGFISKGGKYFKTIGYFEAREYSENLCGVQEWLN